MVKYRQFRNDFPDHISLQLFHLIHEIQTDIIFPPICFIVSVSWSYINHQPTTLSRHH